MPLPLDVRNLYAHLQNRSPWLMPTIAVVFALLFFLMSETANDGLKAAANALSERRALLAQETADKTQEAALNPQINSALKPAIAAAPDRLRFLALIEAEARTAALNLSPPQWEPVANAPSRLQLHMTLTGLLDTQIYAFLNQLWARQGARLILRNWQMERLAAITPDATAATQTLRANITLEILALDLPEAGKGATP